MLKKKFTLINTDLLESNAALTQTGIWNLSTFAQKLFFLTKNVNLHEN